METRDVMTDTSSLPTTLHTTIVSSEPSLQQYDQWVTVFGFQHKDAPIVLQFFRNCGTIVKTKYGPNNANWIHIQ
jgi:hypothetical protein